MEINAGGIVFLALAWGCVITLTIYCFSKVISSERKEKN
jgi:hypothetical protein